MIIASLLEFNWLSDPQAWGALFTLTMLEIVLGIDNIVFISILVDRLPEEQRNALLGQIALGRLGVADDIAKAVAFLASPAAAYITGETLHVTGGLR